MNILDKRRRTVGQSTAIIAVLFTSLLAAADSGPVFAGTAAVTHPSWYGDPSAPNLSGVWSRSGTSGKAAASKEGWLPWPPPLNPAFAATWQKRLSDAKAGTRADDPVVGCQPPGMPRFMTGTNGPLLIMQTPGRATLYRDGIPVRRVWLDGRDPPSAKDLEAFSNGNAVGHYQGGDLVVETIGVKDQPVDATGVPHSDALKIVERYHRVDAKTLRVEVTLTDPEAYSRPMTSTVTYTAWSDPLWEPHEFLCKPKTDYHPDKYVH